MVVTCVSSASLDFTGQVLLISPESVPFRIGYPPLWHHHSLKPLKRTGIKVSQATIVRSALILTPRANSTDGLKVIERFFDLPLDYSQPEGEKIRVFARNLIPKDKAKTDEDEAKLPYCAD